MTTSFDIQSDPLVQNTDGDTLANGLPVSAVAETQHLHSGSSFKVLGIAISSLSLEEAIREVASWAVQKGRAKLVTFTNVHMLTEGLRTDEFRQKHSEMDMNCADGMPLVWLGQVGGENVTRVSGPDFMQAFFARVPGSEIRHYFYGGQTGLAQQVAEQLLDRYPRLKVAGYCSPPFRALTPDEDAAIVEEINRTNADVVWVCLGCPKQEIWIHEHRDRLQASVLLAVGLAFDILAGTKSRAPAALRRVGLEWLYRLAQEPVRLTSRYVQSNSAFLYALLVNRFFRQWD